MVESKFGQQTKKPAGQQVMMNTEEAHLGLINVELSGTDRSKTWLNELDDDEVSHVLRLHQIIIGTTAAKGEEQVIEAEFLASGGKKSTTPLAYLKRGEMNSVQMDVHFPAATTFRLAEGKGPVFILGSHIVAPTPEEDVAESEDIEEEEDDEEDVENGDLDEKHLEHGLLEENLKKRKPEGEHENGVDTKKFKQKNAGNSESEEDAGTDDLPAMEG